MIPSYLAHTHTHLHTIDKLLHAIQIESDYYNMKLNCDRCSNLTVNQHKPSVRYLHGRLVPRKHEAVYLGSLLTDTIDNHGEVAVRLAGPTTTCNRLKLFKKKAQNSIAWKLRGFGSILKSKVLYGLECIQLTTADINKINAFQMKGIRRILHVPPTVINQLYTSQKGFSISTERTTGSRLKGFQQRGKGEG